MDYALAMHIAQDVKHLRKEISPAVLAHTSDGLADVEEETTRHVLEEDVNEVLDLAAAWFENEAITAPSNDVDDVRVLQALENLNLLLDSLDRV